MRYGGILFFLIISWQCAVGQTFTEEDLLQEHDLQYSIGDDKSIHYDLNQMITIIEKSIDDHAKVIIPVGVTEFERLLFTARRIQHNDSQLIAIKLFKFMLEFELYRTKGEELYLRLLMSTSLEYIGSRVLAKKYLEDIFPQFLQYLKDQNHKQFFLYHYAALLLRNKDYKEANQVYRRILQFSQEMNDSIALYTARNNYGHTYQLLGNYDSAAFLYRENQKEKYKDLSPVIYAFSFGNYASILMYRGHLDSAVLYAQKELELLREIPSTEGMGNTYNLLGQCFELMGKPDSACHYYLTAVEHYKQANNVRGIIETIEKVISIKFKDVGDPQFEKLLDEYQAYNDSLVEDISIKTYEGDVNVFNYLKILDETQLSKRQFDILETKNRELNYLVLGLAILLFLLLIIIITRRANRIKLEKANNNLLAKNKALKESYKTISETNTKNEILLKELHHRVKNNLQMIISLFNLQKNSGQLDSKATEMLQIAQDRIFSIALVHKKIYQSEQLIKLNFREYLEAFIEETLGNNEEGVKVKIEVEDFDLSIDSAVPLGLIINELFTNSLKHAKAAGPLEIEIKQTQEEGNCEFIYTDNGQGVDLDKDINRGKNSIGITLIKLFSEQLGAEIEFKRAKKSAYGFWFCIRGKFK